MGVLHPVTPQIKVGGAAAKGDMAGLMLVSEDQCIAAFPNVPKNSSKDSRAELLVRNTWSREGAFQRDSIEVMEETERPRVDQKS